MHSPEDVPGVPSGLLLVPKTPAAPTGALPLLAAGVVLSGLPPAALTGPIGTLEDTTRGAEPGGPGAAVAGTGPLGVATTAVGGEPGGPVTITTGAEPGVATATGMGGEPGGPATAAIGAEPGGPATTITGTALRFVATAGLDVGPCAMLGTPVIEISVVSSRPVLASVGCHRC
jgi:hypothetical protein